MAARPQEGMAISITIKNTFLDVKKLAEDSAPLVKRSSSVPRAFKPGDSLCVDGPHSDDSTNASDKGAPDNFMTSSSWASDSEQDIPDYCSDCTDVDDGLWECAECCSEHSSCGSATQDPSDKSRVTLSLAAMVTEKSEKVRAKLRPQATPFKSARAPPAEVATVIASAVEVLSSGKDISDIQVHDGGMGGTTTIVARSGSKQADACMLFSLVKDALLSAAEQSENTYIIGYGGQPFNNLDPLSFSASVGCVPLAHRNSACWDMYEKGYCPRRATCRWDHPTEVDMMRIIVMIKKD